MKQDLVSIAKIGDYGINCKNRELIKIIWTSNGKVKSIIRDENFTEKIYPDLEFNYDCFGRRISKTVKTRRQDGNKSVLTTPDQWETSYYVHDAQGNEMTSYVLKNDIYTISELKLKEHYIYGASRLGAIKSNNIIVSSCDLSSNTYGSATIKRNNDGQISFIEPINIKIAGLSIINPNEIYTSFDELEDAINNYKSKVDYVAYKDPSDPLNKLIIRSTVYGGTTFDGPTRNISVTGNILVDKLFVEGNLVTCKSKRERGIKFYEVSNYLGNVHEVITDRKIPIENLDGTKTVSFYHAELIQYSDYYPFGQSVTSRSKGSDEYAFAYNGMLKDDEIQGVGNSYTTEFRQYDARLGRWTAVDPMAHEREWVSPYNFVQNNPIMRVDPTGALDDLVITGEQSDKAMEQLQATTTLNLKRDEHTGLVTATGNAQTEIDKKLLTIINSDITVSVEAGNSNIVPGTDLRTRGGAFLGNTITKGEAEVDVTVSNKPFISSSNTIETTTVEAKQYIVPSMLANLDADGGFIGQSILHEVTEAYIGAVYSRNYNVPAGPAIPKRDNNPGSPTYYIYDYAHDPSKNSFVVPQVGDEYLRSRPNPNQ